MRSWKGTSLETRDREAIVQAVRALRASYPLDRAILFGSKARGDADPHSDIDLLLVTTRPLHWREEKAIVDELFDLGMKFDVIFSPLFVSRDEWKGQDFRTFPIYQEIMAEGTTIP